MTKSEQFKPIYSIPNKYGQVAKECVHFQWACTKTYKNTCWDNEKSKCVVLLGERCEKMKVGK